MVGPGRVARYTVTLDRCASRELKRIEPANQRKTLKDAISELRFDPRPAGCTNVVGVRRGYRIRVGDYRVVYVINDSNNSVVVTKVGSRQDIYQRR